MSGRRSQCSREERLGVDRLEAARERRRGVPTSGVRVVCVGVVRVVSVGRVGVVGVGVGRVGVVGIGRRLELATL